MEFDQLRCFLKVAERGSFTRAAEELAMSQPALSRSVARLEATLGQPVFERQTRRISLTDTGRLLQARAQQIMSLIEDTRAEISDDGESGTLRVAAIPTIAPYFLPGLLQAFGKACPQANVVVQEDTTEHLLRRSTQGEIDLAILALPLSAKYLDFEPLFEEELLLVLPKKHPLAAADSVRFADIRSLPFVLLDEAHCLTDNVVSLCRQKSFQPISVERTSQLAMVQELVALGHGISMIPAMARRLDTSRRRVYRSLSGKRATRAVAMLWNPYRFQSKLVQRFRETTREYAGEFVAQLSDESS